MRALNCSHDGSTGWWLGLFSGVGCEGEAPESVVVDPLGVVDEGLPRLPHLQVRYEIPLIPQERPHILVRLVLRPLPAGLDWFPWQHPLLEPHPRTSPPGIPAPPPPASFRP